MTDPTTTTTPTPPEGLTDARLLELAADEIEPYDRIPPGEYEAENERALEVYGSELIAYARAAITAHEAARAQLPPNYIDDGHTGEDRELLEAFYVACRAEGGTADEITLRGIRAAIAADRAARPAPAPNELSVSLRIDSSTESLKRLCDGLAAAVKPDGGYAAATSDDLPPSTGGEQMVQVEWWIPQHGCDSLENTLDAIKARILFAVRDWLATALTPTTAPTPTPEGIEAQFRAWWAESYPHAPVGNHAVASHVAFALHLLGGEVVA